MCSAVEMSGILSAIIWIVLTVKLPIAPIRSCACLQRTLTYLV
jgi:hypothetical protein